jgi:DNA cross-link repair 1A protein
LGRKVYVGAARRSVLGCYLPPEDLALLTTDERATNLQVVSTNCVTFKGLTNLLQLYKARFTTVIGFGSGFEQNRSFEWGGPGKELVVPPRKREDRATGGTVIVYHVPYTEHSSLAELREFVKWLEPARIFPHSYTGERDDDAAALAAATGGGDGGGGGARGGGGEGVGENCAKALRLLQEG